MGSNEEVDQGGKESTKAKFELVTLKILWEEKQAPLTEKVTYELPLCCSR